MISIEKTIERLNQKSNLQGQGVARFPALADKTVNIDPQLVAKPKPEFQLNLKALARAGYLTPDTMQKGLAEQYRHLKWPLLRKASDSSNDAQLEYGNLIAITSALPKEGKTFTAFNLAMSIAMERDTTVLLIDSDLIARSLTHLVGLDGAPGLADLLIDPDINLHDVIVSTNVPKLRLLPAGHIVSDGAELLASEQMRIVAGELSSRYSNRIILFDTAPILATSQALVLTALVGQIVVVVEEGKTPQHTIQDAVSLLDRNKAVGMVLNKSLRLSRGGYYPYYRPSL